jgi:hypothetical protein
MYYILDKLIADIKPPNVSILQDKISNNKSPYQSNFYGSLKSIYGESYNSWYNNNILIKQLIKINVDDPVYVSKRELKECSITFNNIIDKLKEIYEVYDKEVYKSIKNNINMNLDKFFELIPEIILLIKELENENENITNFPNIILNEMCEKIKVNFRRILANYNYNISFFKNFTEIITEMTKLNHIYTELKD